MKENKIYQVITTGSHGKYLILDQGIVENKNYYFVNKLTLDGEDLTDTYSIFEEVIEGEDKMVRPVKDQELQHRLIQFFQEGLEIEDKS